MHVLFTVKTLHTLKNRSVYIGDCKNFCIHLLFTTVKLLNFFKHISNKHFKLTLTKLSQAKQTHPFWSAGGILNKQCNSIGLRCQLQVLTMDWSDFCSLKNPKLFDLWYNRYISPQYFDPCNVFHHYNPRWQWVYCLQCYFRFVFFFTLLHLQMVRPRLELPRHSFVIDSLSN